MVGQSDLDLAMEQLEEMTPDMLSLYAYAAIKLLGEKQPDAIKDGSFDVFISDTPIYIEAFEHEVPVNMNATITVAETLMGFDY
jgi:hypothetical protein